ncbi:MAG: exodeoxyribonuclease V subunit alpha [Deltaproteobacteria bacterium]|nr:exodeoxyribonuclease V subunit alpha [Deltaproteobacteria bacterium]
METVGIEFSDIDSAFGDFIAQQAPDAEGVVAYAAQLASFGMRSGNVCINLQDFADKQFFDERRRVRFRLPPLEKWCAVLAKNPTVATQGEYRPLVLVGDKLLYLHRFWSYEQEVATFFRERIQREEPLAEEHLLRAQALMQQFFPASSDVVIDWQKAAVALSLLRNTVVISGGPGTGKTTTVAKIIALAVALAEEKKLKIALCAPTGKAAIRLAESAAKGNIGGNISDACTVHRLLGYGGKLNPPRFNRNNLLPYDLIILDEASMVDLPLMAALVAAIKPNTKFILLGDKHQLASVEPGAIFGDINDAISANAFSAKTAQMVRRLCGFTVPQVVAGRGEGIVELQKNHRFGDHHPLAIMGKLINDGSAEAALDFIRNAADEGLKLVENGGAGGLQETLLKLQEPYIEAVRANKPLTQLFDLFEQTRILTISRRGKNGAVAINKALVSLWGERGVIKKGATIFSGLPIMANKNNYQWGIANGDTGIVLVDDEGSPLVHFPDGLGKSRVVPLGGIHDWEVAFVSTVHKAQGSEFNEVILLLPGEDSPVLTREVIYTAITRARKSVEIWGKAAILQTALGKTISRTSALKRLITAEAVLTSQAGNNRRG